MMTSQGQERFFSRGSEAGSAFALGRPCNPSQTERIAVLVVIASPVLAGVLG